MSPRRPGHALALALALAVPPAARAGPVVGLRVGWASSFGDAVDSLAMTEVVREQFPLQLDALWRLGSIAVGLYATYGLGIAGGCDPGASCAASSFRVGGEGSLTFPTVHGIEPWAGAGLGGEWTTRESERDGARLEWVYRGPEASLQGGADFRVHRRIALGPFILLSLGRYERVSLDTPVETGSRAIGEKSFHAWLEIGVRGTFDIWDEP